MTTVKRGDLVEFTDVYQRDYTMGDPTLARYGVAVAEETDGTVEVMRADRSTQYVPMRRVVAYAWAGWMPEDLEPVYEELHPSVNDWQDADF